MSKQDDQFIDFERLPAPTFLRLFMTRRVLTLRKVKDRRKVNQLTCDSEDNKTKQIPTKILSTLLDHGIGKYMRENFIESKQAPVIESFFSNVILTKFLTQFKIVTTYSVTADNTDKNEKYQCLLFNTNDLMCLIFTFLNFNDLTNCSLVTSYWLYHAFNPSSIYCANISELIRQTIDTYNVKYQSTITRIVADHVIFRQWQRFVNARDVTIYFDKYTFDNCHSKTMESIANKMSMLANVEKIFFQCCRNDLWIVESLLEKRQLYIKKYESIIIGSGKQADAIFATKQKPLKLMQANEIYIGDAKRCIKWSNKCRKLRWKCISGVSKQWCKDIIDNCDCTAVKVFSIENTTFDFKDFDVASDSALLIIAKLASKFSNLKGVLVSLIY